jgi:ABC-2 type transport system permease protein
MGLLADMVWGIVVGCTARHVPFGGDVMITILQFKNFLRSGALLSGLGLLLALGTVSVVVGKHFLDTQREIMEKTERYQREHTERYVKFGDKDMGLLMYYQRFGLANLMPNLAGLAIGLRDVNPSVHSVTIRNLEEQKYATDFHNPLHQLIGNLDLSFVLIYVFPLIIIAFCFNLISEEKEEGRWSLIRSQAGDPMKMVAIKLGIRYASVLSALVLLLGMATFVLSLPMDVAWWAYSVTAVLYVTFWFGVMWLVASFHKQSSHNALLLLVVWIMLTMVIPASVNAVVVNLYPVPEAFDTMVESRDAYHTKWDQPKEPTIEKFHRCYPQFKQYSHPEGRAFSWLWYYAMQQMGDDGARAQREALRAKLLQRERVAATIGWLIPTIHTQRVFNTVSASGMNNHLRFLESLEDFHEQKRLYYYPKIFEDVPVSTEDWQNIRLEYFTEAVEIDWLRIAGPLCGMIILCMLWAKRNFQKA